MASEQFSLCWDNFHKNMSSGMHSLLETEDLVDVTLAVEGKYLKAHKMVLSVCSPYFRNLFKSNPCKHPIVFMKDVSYSALTDLLQFMYQGEVQVNQENLSTFIKTAEALQIKGLTGDGNSSEDITENNHEETKQQTAPSPQAKRTSREAEDTKSPRIKRPFGPASKRAKVSSVTSVEIKTPSKVDSKSTEETVQFKMEPYESGANVQGGQDDTFGDDPLEDSQADDADDYSVMEGSEEEPQAGTSGDAVGEGQDPSAFVTRPRLHRGNTFVHNGFCYYNDVATASVRYLQCAEVHRTVCKARAILPIGADISQLKVTREHNHPPDPNAEARDEFLRELKLSVTVLMQHASLKNVYETVALRYDMTDPFRDLCYTSMVSNILPYTTAKAETVVGHMQPPFWFHESNHMLLHARIIFKDTFKRVRTRKMDMPRYIVDGFVFHVNIMKGDPPMTYLRCLEYKRLGCHARAVIPGDGTIQDIKVNKPHNHPPDYAAEQKIVFLRELKEVTVKNPWLAPREIYTTLSEMYPLAARETPYEIIRHKMNRWRRGVMHPIKVKETPTIKPEVHNVAM